MNPPDSSGVGRRRLKTDPAGYLFSNLGLLVLAALLLLAAWGRQTVIALAAGLTLAAAGLTRLGSRLALVGVSAERKLGESRAFPGETLELGLRLTNRKPLPLLWARVEDALPAGLEVMDAAPGDNPNTLARTGSLPWYSAVTWRGRLRCRKRGDYPLGPLTVTSGDIFGLYPRSATQPVTDHIIVYPRLYPLNYLTLPSLAPIGETKAERRIFEDLTRPIGVRDYRPGDSMKHIHWKASARQRGLQVKVFEPTTTLKVVIFLAVDTFAGTSEDDFELGVSMAASLARYATDGRSQVGLFLNARTPGPDAPAAPHPDKSPKDRDAGVRLPPRRDAGHLVTILEALARVTPPASGEFTAFLAGVLPGLPWGATLALVLARPPAALPGLLHALRMAGHKPVVFQIGGETPPADGFPRYHVRSGEELTALGAGGLP